MSPIDKVLAKFPDARRSGDGWTDCCPAHDDHRPSLSINEAEDSRVLMKCHAGCRIESILQTKGLTFRDLMPTGLDFVNVNGDQPRKSKTPKPLAKKSKSEDRDFATLEEAIADQERKIGCKCSARWNYHDSDGKVVGAVLRWNLADGKLILPFSLNGDRWKLKAMPPLRPLKNLLDLAGARRVIVGEGEQVVDAATSLGFTATTSAGGAKAPHKTDWSPLAGKEVVILPDNDPAGRAYADEVQLLLHRLDPRPKIKILDLPNLPDAGDLLDFKASFQGTPEAMRSYLENEIDQLPIESPLEDWLLDDSLEPFEPFPFEVLPSPVSEFIRDAAKAIGCDPSFIALPLLTVLATAIGNSRRLEVKKGWLVPAILWTAIVGESGSSKTPAFRAAMKALKKRQEIAMEKFEAEWKLYKQELLQYEKQLALWKKNQSDVNAPLEPILPICDRSLIADITIEALATILQENPRGVLLACDELAGWFGSFDRYASGKSSADASKWLSMFGAESIHVDRKTGFPKTIQVRQAFVCVTGGIQPSILHRALGAEHRESGLAARILLACPPRKSKRWSEAEIAHATERMIAGLIDRLFSLEMGFDEDGRPVPQVLTLSMDAKRIWVEFYNRHATEQNDLTGELSAAWSKLEEYALRLALIIELVKQVMGEQSPDPWSIQLSSMESAILLVEWFKREAKRVYRILNESDEEREQRRLVEWLTSRGKPLTSREVQMGCRWLRQPSEAEQALIALQQAGLGVWENSPAGARGKPTRRFRLTLREPNNGNPTIPE